uniref:Extradiol ring-cleavage dioxygenase class III enzyme subunit B domain-containing protein n=2 Tax=Populus TaxID=3689 RepID=A0A4V6A3Y6_POPAL|nr:hypothetical protein D5086_0000251840 [Populus alba]
MMAIDESIPARKFFKTWQQIFKERPKAILVISGHWDTKEPTVNVVNRNDTIYDFYGFPKSMYKVLMANGFKRVKEDKTRGVDHGTWVPLMFMYPEADIPVCQLSVQTDRDGTYHYNLGKALAPLREEVGYLAQKCSS